MTYKSNPIILQVLPSLNSGGVERGTIEIAKALRNDNITSYVASSGGKLISELEKIKVDHFELNLCSKNPYIIFKNIFTLLDIIKKYNINIIHARSRAPAWSVYFATRLTRIKFVTTFHGVYSFNNILKKYYNSIMTKSNIVIAVSQFIKDHIVENYNKNNIQVIHRGVDPDYFNPKRLKLSEINKFKFKLNIENKKIILIPGRITSWKGHLYLLETLSKVKSSFHCIIVGEHKENFYFSKIISTINKYNLKNYITILPNQSDMPLIYMLSDIVISASIRAEAFGRTIIEAQAMEKLVIATELGGATETIINEKTGWLVPYNDANRFADIVDYVLNLEEIRKFEITSFARQHIINNFSLSKMTSKTISLYKNLLI